MDTLSEAFFALSDPTRRAILARLAKGEATVSQLAEPFEMSQPAISRHLKILTTAGLVTQRVEGTRRPCRLQEAGMQGVDQWLATMREAMARNYERLDSVLAAQIKKKRSPRA